MPAILTHQKLKSSFMEGSTTIKLKSQVKSPAEIWHSEKSNATKAGSTLPASRITIKELHSREDLDRLYEKMEGLENTILIIHQLDLLNGATDLKPAAIFAAPCTRNRISRQIQQLESKTQAYNPHDDLKAGKKCQGKKNIIIHTHDGFEVIRTKEINHITAERAYCQIFLTQGRKLTVSKPLREIEDLLPACFFRCHHSHLINLKKVQAYKKEDGGLVVMKDGSKVPVARARKEEMVRVLVG